MSSYQFFTMILWGTPEICSLCSSKLAGNTWLAGFYSFPGELGQVLHCSGMAAGPADEIRTG